MKVLTCDIAGLLILEPQVFGDAPVTAGLLVSGTVRREADGGRTIVASQFFLQAA